MRKIVHILIISFTAGCTFFYGQAQAISQNDLLVVQRKIIVEKNAIRKQQDSVEIVYQALAQTWQVNQYRALAEFYRDLSQVRDFYEVFEQSNVKITTQNQGITSNQTTQEYTQSALIPTDEHLSARALGLAKLYQAQADFQQQANELWTAVWQIKKRENDLRTQQELLVLDQARYQRLNSRYRPD